MAHLPESLLASLAAGTTVVTPNNRLARSLTGLFDEAQRAAGRRAWAAARVLPWEAWLETLWQDAIEAEAEDGTTPLLSRVQTRHLWQKIVAAQNLALIDAAGAANTADEAWTLVHEWGAGGESWRGWSIDGVASDDDPAQFAAWANRYQALLDDNRAIDFAKLPDRIAACAARVPARRATAVVLVGFARISPQQQRLLDAIASAGTRVDRGAALLPSPRRIFRASLALPRDEIACALGWARGHALDNPGATIAIAIEDLAQRRAEVRALADDILCPALQWPGHEDAPRPYNISYGEALAAIEIVAAALDVIALAQAPLETGRAAALLRSPYIAGAGDALPPRAALERKWLEQGLREVSLADVVESLNEVDPTLAHRWRALREPERRRENASPREWVSSWRDYLYRAGWPGDRALASPEFQARRALDEALVEFAGMGSLTPSMSPTMALTSLRELLSAKVFQPEGAPAPVQILGLLEAAGIPFDGLWVAGLDSTRWPGAPDPNPMLPLAWQLERNVPRASAANQLEYARTLTAQFACAAPEVVFSHPAEVDDGPGFASMLVPEGAQLPANIEAVAPGTARIMFDARPALESVDDTRAPALPSDAEVGGGAGLIEAQSDCPFRAVALHRLRSRLWPRPIDGISAQERGTLVHAALAAFWSDVRTHAALVALTPDVLDAAVAKAVQVATVSLDPARRRAIPATVLAQEPARMDSLIRTWLEDFERERPPFSVAETEWRIPLALSGIVVKLTLDRVDALGDGGAAIIDYKIGEVIKPTRWFSARPEAPQLGLYALAHHAASEAVPLRAVVYARLKPGMIGVVGLAADSRAWPRVPEPSATNGAGPANWIGVKAVWAEQMSAMCAEVRTGVADVAPRDRVKTCRRCGLQSLCRIGTAAIGNDVDGDDD